MRFGTLVLPHELAKEYIDTLSRNTHMQFIDMNERSMDRPYKQYVQRLDNMERILRFLYQEIHNLPGASGKLVESNIDEFLKTDHLCKLDQVEESLLKLYEQFVKFKNNNKILMDELDQAYRELAVMKAAQKHLSIKVCSSDDSYEISETQGLVGKGSIECNLTFSNVAGVLPTSSKANFSRALFRAMRGNAYTIFQDVVMDSTEGKHAMDGLDVFVVYCQISQHSLMYNKIVKLCTAFNAELFPWVKDVDESVKRSSELNEIIADKQRALTAYENYFIEEIGCLLETSREGGNSVIEEWRLFCKKEKLLYYVLNHFQGSDVMLRADCWFPVEEEEHIRRVLTSLKSNDRVSALLLTCENADTNISSAIPPTWFKENAFLNCFQGIVDTYGIPRYREINPAPFTAITFPFLFGIMFGDLAHGICVFLFGLGLILYANKIEKKFSAKDDNLFAMIFRGRYMILLMGLFAIYCGLAYNDALSLPIGLIKSRWVQKDGKMVMGDNFPIPFGLDVAWIGAENEQAMLSSYKMKFAVIVGFFHMLLGVILHGLNAFYFHNKLNFYFDFLPKLLLLVAFVGYMDFLIVYKWLMPIDTPFNKPSIITTIIEMYMFKKLSDKELMYPSQQVVQYIVVILCMISMPLMLLPKPLYYYILNRSKKRRTPSIEETIVEMERGGVNFEEAEHEEESVADIFIHQLIETIEFGLGVVSNTASYLRLWALSLAHQQLSAVFFKQIILNSMNMSDNIVVTSLLLFIASIFFTIVTVLIILCMDSLECYLHALRLQWVEFQNKFFKADGVLFQPVDLRNILPD